MPKMTFKYRFRGEHLGIMSGITEEDHKKGQKLLKKTFPSAKMTLQLGTHDHIVYIEYSNTDTHTLNRIIEREVVGVMTKTDKLRAEYLPSFTLRKRPSDREILAQLVPANQGRSFMFFDDLPFGYSETLRITNWDQWLTFVDLELARVELQKLIQKKEDITYGDKILTLLKNDPSQAIALLEHIQDELTKAELGVIVETINTYIRTLSKSFVI